MRGNGLSDLLLLIEHNDYAGLRRRFGKKIDRQESYFKRVKMQLMQLSIAMHDFITNDQRCRSRFNDALKKIDRRELKERFLLRDIILFLCTDYSKAGIYATALAEAVKQNIQAFDIPKYVNENGGISALLEAERRRRRAKRAVDLEPKERETLRVIAPCEDAEALREGGKRGTWALIVSRTSRNGAGTTFEVVEIGISDEIDDRDPPQRPYAPAERRPCRA